MSSSNSETPARRLCVKCHRHLPKFDLHTICRVCRVAQHQKECELMHRCAECRDWDHAAFLSFLEGERVCGLKRASKQRTRVRAEQGSSGVQDREETRRGSLDGTEVLQGVQLGSPVRQSCPETEVELS